MPSVKKEVADKETGGTVSDRKDRDKLSRAKRKVDRARRRLMLVKTDLRIMKKKYKLLEQRVRQLQETLDRDRAGLSDPDQVGTGQVVTQ